MLNLFGDNRVIHRASYIDILLEEAKAAGARLSLGVSVTDIAFETSHVILEDGRKLEADVIVGADGRNDELGLFHDEFPIDAVRSLVGYSRQAPRNPVSAC